MSHPRVLVHGFLQINFWACSFLRPPYLLTSFTLGSFLHNARFFSLTLGLQDTFFPGPLFTYMFLQMSFTRDTFSRVVFTHMFSIKYFYYNTQDTSFPGSVICNEKMGMVREPFLNNTGWGGGETERTKLAHWAGGGGTIGWGGGGIYIT